MTSRAPTIGSPRKTQQITIRTKRHRRPMTRGEYGFLAAALVGILLCHTQGWLAPLESKLLDLKLRCLDKARRSTYSARLGAERPKSSDVVLIEFDEETIYQSKFPVPLSRRYLAGIVDYIAMANPKSIALCYSLATRGALPAEDEEMQKALKRFGRVMVMKETIGLDTAMRTRHSDPFYEGSFLAEGSLILLNDSFGHVKGYHLVRPAGAQPEGSLGLLAMLHHVGGSMKDVEIDDQSGMLEIARKDQRSVEVPLMAEKNGLLLDIVGPARPFARYSWLEMTQKLSSEPKLLEGKLVVVGDAYSSAHLSSVAVGPGSMRHLSTADLLAHAVYQLLERQFLRQATSGETSLMALAAILPTLLLFHLFYGAMLPGLVTLASFGLFLASSVTFVIWRIDVPIAPTMLALLIPGFGLWLYRTGRQDFTARTATTETAGSLGLPVNTIDRLGQRYAELEPLGRGGMGRVIAAVDKTDGSRVAIKLPEMAMFGKGDQKKRFEREIASLARLDHPNIIRLVDMHLDVEPFYYVMQLVEGETLRTRLDTVGKMEMMDAVALMLPIAHALSHAHGQGMLHRDLKPENFLISMEGNPFLTDFGLVYFVNETRLTRDSGMLGTPIYLSPEAMKGDEDPSVESEVYSYGTVLYEMLSGAVPFPTAKIHLRMTEEPPPLDLPSTPGARRLRDLVARCLRRQAADRFHSFDEVIRELERVVEDK